MKIENGKITCTECGHKRATLTRLDDDGTAIVKCNKCNREVECDRGKVSEALFDTANMEGKKLNAHI